jgi:hypothetical protein
MSKKKQRITLANLAQVPLTPVVNKTGFETLKEFTARLEREKEAPIKEAIEVQRQAFLKLRKLASEFWSRPVGELQLGIYQDSARDVTFTPPPPVREQYSREDLIAACDKWYADSFSKSGFNLNPDGVLRLCCFGESQARAGCDFSQPLGWQAAFDHLKDNLHAFGDELDSSRVPQPVETPEVQPQPTLDELLETTSGESAAGRKKLIDAVTEDLSNGEYRACWSAFVTSIYDNFRYVLNDREKRLIYDTLLRRGRLNSPRDYDAVRVNLVQAGSLPSHLLYPAEKLAIDVESADLNDREVRREFARRTYLLANPV